MPRDGEVDSRGALGECAPAAPGSVPRRRGADGRAAVFRGAGAARTRTNRDLPRVADSDQIRSANVPHGTVPA